MVAWRVQGHFNKITCDIKAVCPKSTMYSIGDASHMSRSSDHNVWNWGYGNVVSAIDSMIRGGITSDIGRQMLKALIGRAGIQYVIFEGYIYNRAYNWKKRKYNGSDQHYDRLHVSAVHSVAADRMVEPFTWGVAEVAVKKPSAAKPVKKTYVRITKTLQRGDEGEQVKTLQHRLGIPEDGDFGPRTHNGVCYWQKKLKLKVDGIVGPLTRAALKL